MIEEYFFMQCGIFVVVATLAFFLDLYSHRKTEHLSLANATLWSCFWVVLSLLFALYIGKTQGSSLGMLFLSGYFLEKSLSVDNLFAFMAVFSSFAVRQELQHRVLYYGILGAIVLRFVFISLGSTLLLAFGEIVLALFGILVLWSAWKMWEQSRKGDVAIEDYSNHWSVRLTKKIFPIYPRLEGNAFFVKKEGKWYATPLFLCLVAIEVADVLFAFDSIPAVFSVFGGLKEPLPASTQMYLMYTSNIFAILGLRSLYFLLAAATNYLVHLEKAVIIILAFVGIKMLAGVFDIFSLSPEASLGIVLFLLFAGALGSILYPAKSKRI